MNLLDLYYSDGFSSRYELARSVLSWLWTVLALILVALVVSNSLKKDEILFVVQFRFKLSTLFTLPLLQCVVLWKEFHQQPQQRLRMLYPLISQAGQGKIEPKFGLMLTQNSLMEWRRLSASIVSFSYLLCQGKEQLIWTGILDITAIISLKRTGIHS